MSPADIRKEGAAYDLPLAVGILASDEKIETGKLSEYMLMGELSLDGSILPIKGALPIAIKAREEGFNGLIILFIELDLSEIKPMFARLR